MTDFRILAVGIMALLAAAYSASSASGTNLKRAAIHRKVLLTHDVHVDGFDLPR
jgi:hypothetical protein